MLIYKRPSAFTQSSAYTLMEVLVAATIMSFAIIAASHLTIAANKANQIQVFSRRTAGLFVASSMLHKMGYTEVDRISFILPSAPSASYKEIVELNTPYGAYLSVASGNAENLKNTKEITNRSPIYQGNETQQNFPGTDSQIIGDLKLPEIMAFVDIECTVGIKNARPNKSKIASLRAALDEDLDLIR